MAAASKLMLMHGIQQSELMQSKSVAGRSETTEIDTDWQKVAADAAGKLFGCMTLFSKSRTNGIPVFYYVGRPDNHDAARQTFSYLCDQIERLYKNALPRGMTQKDRANFRRTFKYACAHRVYVRAVALVQEMSEQGTGEEGGTALVVQNHFDKLADEVDTFLKDSGVNIRMVRPKRRSAGLGTAAGFVAGDAVNLRGTLK